MSTTEGNRSILKVNCIDFDFSWATLYIKTGNDCDFFELDNTLIYAWYKIPFLFCNDLYFPAVETKYIVPIFHEGKNNEL